MAFWSWLVGTPKAVEKVIDTGANVINKGMEMVDNAFFTDQEKSQEKIKWMDLFLKLQTLIANDSGVSAIARRAAATLIFATFCFLVTFACLVYNIDSNWSLFILSAIEKSGLGYLAIGAGVFFFGLYAFGKYTKWGTTATDAFKEKEEEVKA